MSNFNMSAIKRIVNQLGLEAQLIPSAVQPKTCIKVIINGIEFKSSNWTKAEAESILLSCKEGEFKKEVLRSQEDTREIIVNPKEELNRIIDFKNKPLTYCLEEYRTLTETSNVNSLKHYTEIMKDFHGELAENKARELINNNMVYIVNSYVYTFKGLQDVIDTWAEANQYINKIDHKQVINKYVKALQTL